MKKKLLTLTGVIALIAVIAVVFTACIPSDAAKAKDRLEAADYEVEVVYADDTLGQIAIKATEESLGIEGIESMVYGMKDLEDFVVLYYFDTAENAKAAYDKILAEADEEEEDEDVDYGRSGKVIYAGTVDAVKVIK